MTIFPLPQPVETLQLQAATGGHRDHLRHRRARVRVVASYAHVAPRPARRATGPS